MKQTIEIPFSLYLHIYGYFKDQWEEDTGAPRDSIVDDCMGAQLYDALMEFEERRRNNDEHLEEPYEPGQADWELDQEYQSNRFFEYRDGEIREG